MRPIPHRFASLPARLAPCSRLPLAAVLALVAALASALTVRADAPRGSLADERARLRSQSPYFALEGAAPGEDPFPLKSTDVKFTISGVIAEVVVTQTYANESQRPLHGRYVFPASTRAAVHGMTMTIGDDVIRAKIKKKDEARAEYDAAKREGKNAALLEEERPNVFTMAVANVMPGDTVRVELRYTEHVVPEEGVYEFVYPTVVGPRYVGATANLDGGGPAGKPFTQTPYTRAGAPPEASFALSGSLEAGVPLQAMASPSHKLKSAWKGGRRVEVVLDASERLGANRDFRLRYRLAGEEVSPGLLLYRGERENFFLLTVDPPKQVAPDAVPAREYVFVLDVSGSMRGFPLETAKALLRDLVGGLRAQDRFNVVLFSGATATLAPRSVPGTTEEVERAFSFIDRQQGGGGTEMLAGLRTALALPAHERMARSFVVVTDGYIAEERAAFTFIRQNLGRASFFCFGIGSSVNRHLVEGVAAAGLGEPFVVTDEAEGAAAAERFRRYIEAPSLTRVKVQFDGFSVYDVEPRSVPDVLADRPVVMYGKWSGPARGKVRVTGLTGRGAYAKDLDVGAVAPSETNAPLAYVWARARVRDLADLSFGEATDEEREEVTAIGLAYNLLTPYTSFIAVRDVVRNPGGAGKETDQPLALPLGVEDTAIGDMEAGTEPELVLLLALLVAFAAWTERRRFSSARPAGRSPAVTS